MIIHIGWDICVETDDLLAIFPKKSAMASTETAAFIRNMKKAGRFTPCAEGEHTYLLVQEGEDTRLIATSIHVGTLFKRMRANGLYDITDYKYFDNGSSET